MELTGGPIRIVRISEPDWRQVRDLRLLALADTPYAFEETFLGAVMQTEDDWRERARRCTAPGQVGFGALDGNRWVGTMRAVLDRDGLMVLLSVFVVPTHRGRGAGVTDALLDAIENWVCAQGFDELYLDVHEDNTRAQALYRRRGYCPTGSRQPYALNPAQQEIRMRRVLRPPARRPDRGP